MTYPQTLVAWLERLAVLHSKEIDLGLERVRKVALDLAVLQPAPYVITVAGTNGKGSSVAMLESILLAAGYRVGSYTSPHVLRFNERIKINGVEVGDPQIVQAFELIEQARKETSLTYFEFATLAGLVVFNQIELDVVILEVGLGGRLDAVNIVDANACLLTSIDIDHCDWLGNEREKIGYEKAGVMRKNALAICSDPSPPKSVITHADAIAADLKLLGRDYSFSALSKGVEFKTNEHCFVFRKPLLKGDFQLQNAAGVVALLQMQSKLKVALSAINQGLQSVSNPGRLQTITSNNQAWLFDVAHNPQSVKMLAHYLAQQIEKPGLAIFSGLADKDLLPMVEQIKPFVNQWVVVDLGVPRASSIDELVSFLATSGVVRTDIQCAKHMDDAIILAKNSCARHILVYGSFITVSQAMERLGG